MNIRKTLETDLIKELGIDKLPEDQREKVLQDMGEVVYQRIIIRFAEKLSDEQKEEANKFIEGEDMEGFGKFIEENIENSDEIVKEEIAKYKEEVMDLFKNVTEK